MSEIQKEGDEDFVENIWKKVEFHKGASRPLQKPRYPVEQENKVEEEIIRTPEKPKKSKKQVIIFFLIVAFALIVIFILLNREKIHESSMPVAEHEIPEDYTAYYKFENNLDETGKYHGDFENGAFIYSDILRGRVLRLDGEDDYFSIGDKMGLENTEEISVSMWIKSEDVSHTLIGKELIWRVDFDGYKLRFSTGDNWENALHSDVLDASEWTHIAAFHNSSRKCIYINGNLNRCIETEGGNFGDNAYPVIIGCRPDLEDCWKGTIDEAMIFSRGLEEKEIEAIYELQKIEELPSVSPFAGLWDRIRNLFL
jgi:hypothetical protein